LTVAKQFEVVLRRNHLMEEGRRFGAVSTRTRKKFEDI
jgi:hypothetical protein